MQGDGRPLSADGPRLEAVAKGPAIQQDSPADARACFMRGMRSLQEGRFDAAVDELSRAVALDAQDPEYLFRLGAALIGAGRGADEAYACYQRGWRSIPTMRRPRATWAIYWRAGGGWTRRSAATAVRWPSIRACPRRTTTWALR